MHVPEATSTKSAFSPMSMVASLSPGVASKVERCCTAFRANISSQSLAEGKREKLNGVSVCVGVWVCTIVIDDIKKTTTGDTFQTIMFSFGRKQSAVR